MGAFFSHSSVVDPDRWHVAMFALGPDTVDEGHAVILGTGPHSLLYSPLIKI